MTDKYVLIVKDDRDDLGPLVLEQYLKYASIKEITRRKKYFEARKHIRSVVIAKIILMEDKNVTHTE